MAIVKEGEDLEEEPKFFYCESCGVQLLKPEDRGGNDPENTWCKMCCNEDGSHKSREEIKKMIAKKIIQGYDAYTVMGEKIESEEEAEKMAEDYMKTMPAWKPEEPKEEEAS